MPVIYQVDIWINVSPAVPAANDCRCLNYAQILVKNKLPFRLNLKKKTQDNLKKYFADEIIAEYLYISERM